MLLISAVADALFTCPCAYLAMQATADAKRAPRTGRRATQNNNTNVRTQRMNDEGGTENHRPLPKDSARGGQTAMVQGDAARRE